MTRLVVVSDASPLIALSAVGLLWRFEPVFATCIVPPAVDREIRPSVSRPSWISVRPLTRPLDSRIATASLDLGESEALSLALEIRDIQVLIDERRARRLARRIGVHVIGTVGLLVEAKRLGVVPSIQPILAALVATGFFLAPDVVTEGLRLAEEAP